MATKYPLKNNTLSIRTAAASMHKPGYKFSVEKRIQVISTWLALGNLRQSATMCGVSYELCQKWKTQPWWAEMVAEIQNARQQKVDNKLNKIIDKALAVIEDRLDNGDFVYNQKTGEVHRKQVSLKEARGAANDMMQRQVALSKLEIETKSASTQNSVKDQIAQLAEAFSQFNTKRTLEVVPKEINALHDQRETKLQEGERPLQQQASSSESPNGAQRSASGDGESWESVEGGRDGCGPQEASEQGGDEFDDELTDGEQDDKSQLQSEWERQSQESEK